MDVSGCSPERLKEPRVLAALFEELIVLLELKVVGQPQWHVFPEPGGITGLTLLAESHLAVHTFPEHGSLCLNLFCCCVRAEWDFARGLDEAVGAELVTVRRLERVYGSVVPTAQHG